MSTVRGLLVLALASALVTGCTSQHAVAPSPMAEAPTVTKTVSAAPDATCDDSAMQAFSADARTKVTQAYCATATAPGAKRPTQWALVQWESGVAGGESVWVYLRHTSEMICGNTTSCWTAADPAIDGMWDRYAQGVCGGAANPSSCATKTNDQLSGNLCSGGGAMGLQQLASCVPDDAAATIWVAMVAAQGSPGASPSP